MPVYNAEDYLVEAIDSILNQTFTDFELVIINDASTDKSEDIIKSYADPRIKYHKNEVNLKLIGTLNKGLDLLSGTYLARMDADDISTPDRFEKQLEAFEADKDLVCCGTAMNNFDDETGNSYDIVYSGEYEYIRFRLLFGCHIAHATALIKLSVIQNNNIRYNEKYIHCEDHDFFYRISLLGKITNTQKVLYKRRVHNNSITQFYRNILNETRGLMCITVFENTFLKLTEEQKHIYRNFISNSLSYTFAEIEILLHLFDKMVAINREKNLYAAQYFDAYYIKVTLSILNRKTEYGMPIYALAKKLNIVTTLPGRTKFLIILFAKCTMKKKYPPSEFSNYD